MLKNPIFLEKKWRKICFFFFFFTIVIVINTYLTHKILWLMSAFFYW